MQSHIAPKSKEKLLRRCFWRKRCWETRLNFQNFWRKRWKTWKRIQPKSKAVSFRKKDFILIVFQKFRTRNRTQKCANALYTPHLQKGHASFLLANQVKYTPALCFVLGLAQLGKFQLVSAQWLVGVFGVKKNFPSCCSFRNLWLMSRWSSGNNSWSYTELATARFSSAIVVMKQIPGLINGLNGRPNHNLLSTACMGTPEAGIPIWNTSKKSTIALYEYFESYIGHVGNNTIFFRIKNTGYSR